MTAVLFSAAGAYARAGIATLATAWQPYAALLTAATSSALLLLGSIAGTILLCTGKRTSSIRTARPGATRSAVNRQS
jgi:hypothetical protein